MPWYLSAKTECLFLQQKTATTGQRCHSSFHGQGKEKWVVRGGNFPAKRPEQTVRTNRLVLRISVCFLLSCELYFEIYSFPFRFYLLFFTFLLLFSYLLL